MRCSLSSSTLLTLVMLSVFLFFLPLTSTYAKEGCCSKHGGVAGCNAQGMQTCKDGTVSPTCKCEYKGTKSKSQKGTVTTTKGAGVTTTTTMIPTKITGCCSRHGGVAGCNAQGYQTCKDGTTSPNCKCTPIKTKSIKGKTTTTTTGPAGAVTTTKTKTKTTTAGCCSRHGGVAKCDKKAGFLLCKDGTQSNCPCK